MDAGRRGLGRVEVDLVRAVSKDVTTAVAYIRVSSRAQDHATQRAAIERAALARGDEISTWYAEKKSAKTMARAELQRLRDDARMGTLKTLYVFKLDRLVRTGVADTFAVISELRKAGVTLIAVADNLAIVPDKEDVTSEVLVFALGLAARLERAAINDRISAARERVEAEGRTWGRPRSLDDGQLHRVQELARSGRSQREIAVALKIPKSTVGRLLLPQKDAARDPQGDPRDPRRNGGAVPKKLPSKRSTLPGQPA